MKGSVEAWKGRVTTLIAAGPIFLRIEGKGNYTFYVYVLYIRSAYKLYIYSMYTFYVYILFTEFFTEFSSKFSLRDFFQNFFFPKFSEFFNFDFFEI